NFPIPECRHPAGDLKHLLEAVGHEQDAKAPGGDVPHGPEDALDAISGQVGSRLMDDEKATLGLPELVKRSDDRDLRLVRLAQRGDLRLRIDVEPEGLEDPPHVLALATPLDSPAQAEIVTADAHILQHAGGLDQTEVL